MKSFFPVFLLACTSALWSDAAFAANCGALNQRPCKVWERVPSCDKGLAEHFGQNKCVKKGSAGGAACGANNQRPCTVIERIPSCDKGLVEDFGANKCVAKNALSCGARNQRPCTVVERIPSCNKGLVEDFKYNKCLLSAESSIKEFEAFFKKFGQSHKPLFDALKSLASHLTSQQNINYYLKGQFKQDLQARKLDQIIKKAAIAEWKAANPEAFAKQFIPKTLTIGIVQDGGVGAGGSFELGIAINLTNSKPYATVYRTLAVSAGLITGADVTVSVSFWNTTPDQFIGEGRGISASGGELVVGGSGAWFHPLPGIGTLWDFEHLQGFGWAFGVGASVLPVDMRGTLALTQNWHPGRIPEWDGGPCGSNGIRPCHVVERIPSCDKGLKEDFIKHQCVPK